MFFTTELNATRSTRKRILSSRFPPEAERDLVSPLPNIVVQKTPFGIDAGYQPVFFLASPAFDFFFSFDGLIDPLKTFHVDKVNAILTTREVFLFGCGIQPVLVQTFAKVVGDANVKHLFVFVRRDVNEVIVNALVEHRLSGAYYVLEHVRSLRARRANRDDKMRWMRMNKNAKRLPRLKQPLYFKRLGESLGD